MIYRGILGVSRDLKVREFALEHLQTEQQHLAMIESILPSTERSRLQWPWRIAGAFIGALPALIGRQWVFATIETVEAFVDEHYSAQLKKLHLELPQHAVIDVLESCRADEIMHREDAAARLRGEPSGALSLWLKAVDLGSRCAVVVARAF